MRPPNEPFPFRNLVLGVAMPGGVPSGGDAGTRRPTLKAACAVPSEVEEGEGHQLRPVLRQPPVPGLHVAELPIGDPERVLDLGADRGLGPLHHRLVTVQEGSCHREIVHVSRRRYHTVDGAGVRVHTDVRLHAVEPLVPLPGLVHLRVPRAGLGLH